MLFLLFQLGKDWYAFEASDVIEVLPMVKRKEIPGAPRGVAGVFNYHGANVPLIDLSALALGTPAGAQMSTRIILANYSEEKSRETHPVGFLAEQVTEVVRRDEADFVDPPVNPEGATYLGPITHDTRGIIQRVRLAQLLSEDVRDVLFRQPLLAG